MELRILGPLQVIHGDRVLAVGGPRERALLVALALRVGDAVGSDVLIDAVWGARPPRSAAKLLQNHVLRLRKLLGASAIETRDGGYALALSADAVDARRFEVLAHEGRRAVGRGEGDDAVVRFTEALTLWRGVPGIELGGWAPADAERARLSELHRLVEEEAIDARLTCGDDAGCAADLEALVAAEPLREHRWAQLMIALYRGGRQGDALRAYQRARTTLATELGVEPGPELRAVEAAVIAQEPVLDLPAAPPRRAQVLLPSGVVTFLLTDVEGSTRLWDEHPEAMGAALLRHDDILGAAVAFAGGVLLKSRGEGDSTFSVFARASDAVAAALTARDALDREVWADDAELSVRFAVHTGEAVERDGDFYGPAVNRAARIRAIGAGGRILVSQAAAELVRDHLPDDADLVELGAHALRGLERPERVFALVEPGRPGRDLGDTVSPYPGLRAFQAEDRERFFGREALVDVLIARVTGTRSVAVVGASGNGKSSLVRAGVVPRLPDDRRVVVMTPGSHPLADSATHALATAAVDGAALVMVVDQLEELFTLCEDDDERRHFLDALVAAVTTPHLRTAVIVALRADFYGRCADHPGFAALIEGATVLLGPMQPDERRAAIEGPARVSGLRLEPGLADLVLADIADEPGGLPLLSHALLETWRRRRGRTLTVRGYRESGGVRGAIARTADAIYDSLPAEQQATAREVFVRLTELGEGTDDTRRRVRIDELAAPQRADEVAAVVDILADARLVTVGEQSTVEVAHEALIREWPRLRAWLDEDREGLRMLRQLNAAADEWAALGRDAGALYRGTRLASVAQWLALAPNAQLNAREREFIDASEAAHNAELQDARETTRRLRVLATGLGVAFVIALVAGTLALLQRRDANREATRATRNATLAESARLDALARTLPTRRIDLALLLGVEDHRLLPSVTSDGGLESALSRTPPGLERVVRFDAQTAFAAATDDGRLLAAAGIDGNVRLYDVRGGRLIRTLDGHNAKSCETLTKAGSLCAPAAAFSSDASMVAAGGFEKVTVWRVATGEPIGPPIVPGGTIVYSWFDPTDATHLYTASNDGTVARWDLRDPTHPKTIGDRFRFPIAAGDNALGVVSPDGRSLAAGGFNTQRTEVWDVASHRQLYEVPGAPGPFSADGSTLTTSSAGRVAFWDAATGEPRGDPITGLPSVVPRVIFSADGHRLAVGDFEDNPTIQVFDVASRKPIGPARRFHRSYALPITFLRDGRLITNGADEAGVWSLDVRVPPTETVLRVPDGTAVAQFSPDPTEVITVGGDRRVRAWDARTGSSRGDFLGGRVATGYPVAFSPDGKSVAAGGADGTFTVWDRASGRELSRTATGHAGWVAVAWDPRSPILATDTTSSEPGPILQDSSAGLWDMSNLRHPVEKLGLRRTIRVGFPTFGFSPDGHTLALATGSAATATIFDLSTGRTLHVIHATFGIVQVAFSPDGQSLAVASSQQSGGRVVLVDTTNWHVRATLAVSYLPDGIAFVNGGARFVTTSFPLSNGTTTQVDLWDSATLQPVGEPVSMPTPEAFLAFANASGTKVAVGTANGNATVIDVDPHSWQQLACTIAGRNLTRSEWTEYLPDRPYHSTCAQWPAGR